MSYEPKALFGSDLDEQNRTSQFCGYAGAVCATIPAEVLPALRRVEAAVMEGMYAVGFLAYEAATGLDPLLPTQELSDFPLLWFAFFRECRELPLAGCIDPSGPQCYELSSWQASITENDYMAAVACIREYIAAGDSYQVNFTLRQQCRFSGNAQALYQDLYRMQPTPYSSFLDLGRYTILSVSPELFFHLENGSLEVKPMKGTASRGRWVEEDVESRKKLGCSEKERAENLMIVDLLRNDLGRISESGSVKVVSLFDIETHETVHQMTSTITSHLRDNVGIVELFQAIFPSGSVTGAPKKRSMEIIAELEDSPRGLYTGCIGFIAPAMAQAVFNVAIRTLVIDNEAGTARLGVGSGITWGSSAAAEFEECLAKALFVRGRSVAAFMLIESLLFDENEGYFLLERHLDRLQRSAGYFGFTFDLFKVRSELDAYASTLCQSRKVRLVLSRNGQFSIEDTALSGYGGAEDLAVSIAETRVDSKNPLLYHKTSCRELYEQELGKKPDCTDVIFLNERDEVTEGTYSNIVVRMNQDLVTPSRESGLLAGTFRAHLLDGGIIKEAVITRRELETAEELYLINSVRKWRRVRLVG